MIIVKIELMSAVTGAISEIGRMYITNDATGTSDRGDYDVGVYRRGTVAIPVQNGGEATSTRAGKVTDYPRQAYNVWRLITRAALAAFPEERKTPPGKAFSSEIVPEVMRGLQLMRKHFDDDGHNWTQGTDMADVQSAFRWLESARADGSAAP